MSYGWSYNHRYIIECISIMDLTSCLYKIYICTVKDNTPFVHPLTSMKLKRNAFVTLIPFTCQFIPIACRYLHIIYIWYLFSV